MHLSLFKIYQEYDKSVNELSTPETLEFFISF